MKHKITDEEYIKQFVSGHCARLTIPLVSVEHIRAAAAVFRELADDLHEVVQERVGTFPSVLHARAAMASANRKLKGGAHYKGAR